MALSVTYPSPPSTRKIFSASQRETPRVRSNTPLLSAPDSQSSRDPTEVESHSTCPLRLARFTEQSVLEVRPPTTHNEASLLLSPSLPCYPKPYPNHPRKVFMEFITWGHIISYLPSLTSTEFLVTDSGPDLVVTLGDTISNQGPSSYPTSQFSGLLTPVPSPPPRSAHLQKS